MTAQALRPYQAKAIAEARGLTLPRDFRAVLREAAAL